MSKVLVDTSIWIDFYKHGRSQPLESLLEENLIVINDLILTEILPLARHLGQKDLVEGMLALINIPLDIDWIVLRHLQLLNLRNGINNVGIPDLIIVHQALEHGFTIWTKDKHFLPMQKYLDLRLF